MRMKANEMTIYHVMRSGSLTGTCAVIGINFDIHHKKGSEIWLCAVAYLGFHFGGGFKIVLEKWGYLHGAKRHAARGEATRLLGGFGGMLPRENFLKMVQFGAF